MGSGAPHSNIKNRSRLAPSFLERVPVEMLGTHAHTQLLPMSFLNASLKCSMPLTSVRKGLVIQ